MSPRKQPRVGIEFPRGKRAVIAQPAQEDDSQRVSWRFGDGDRGGTWPWEPSGFAAEVALELLTFLAEMDKMTWAECSQSWKPRRKRVEASGISAEAQDRLRSIHKDDTEFLEEFRVSGPGRIWAIRVGHVCHVLWWDPEHTVWPTRDR
jgi:hypothetical protein